MQVLAIAPVLPYPATDGLQLVIAEHLAELAVQGHQLTLVCFVAGSVDAPVAPHVESTLFARISTISSGLRRWHYRRQARLLAAFESSLSRQVDHAVTLSATDAAQLQQLATPRALRTPGARWSDCRRGASGAGASCQ